VPVFVLSLKAGGVGLNLTRATHVIHYDRWWNPAVEDQATDRAYRIGQDRPVTVHRLVAEGTVEDKIAAMLADKRHLADAVVGTGEAWLAELSDAELADLVTLSAAATSAPADAEEDASRARRADGNRRETDRAGLGHRTCGSSPTGSARNATRESRRIVRRPHAARAPGAASARRGGGRRGSTRSRGARSSTPTGCHAAAATPAPARSATSTWHRARSRRACRAAGASPTP